MRPYWPVAKTRDREGNDIVLCTYEGCNCSNEACSQFDIWENEYDYDLWDMRIDVYDPTTLTLDRVLTVERAYVVKEIKHPPQPKHGL